jgi:membrane protein
MSLVSRIRTAAQRLFITLELFGQNGLANHAAAGAYGFLLSAIPALLLIAFILLAALRSSAEAVTRLIMNIDLLKENFENPQLIRTFLTGARPGVSGVISILSVIWAARIFALSIQRGLKIIFPGTKAGNVFLDNLMIFAIELLVVVGAILLVLSSRLALMLYELIGSLFGNIGVFAGVSDLVSGIVPVAGLGLLSYCTYRMVPARPPRRLSALEGTLSGIIAFKITSFFLHLFVNTVRYNFLYGTLGNLIILLGDVYFFFYFYFFGAQIACVRDSFDALLFARFRHIRGQAPKLSNLIDRRLFASPGGRLLRYRRGFKEGEIVFTRGELSREVYYILSGEAGILLSGDGDGKEEETLSVLSPGTFFGETSFLLSEGRNATVKALRDLEVFVFPPELFAQILSAGGGVDSAIIEGLSLRLKDTREKIREDGAS